MRMYFDGYFSSMWCIIVVICVVRPFFFSAKQLYVKATGLSKAHIIVAVRKLRQPLLNVPLVLPCQSY